jgi:hypothetical protein
MTELPDNLIADTLNAKKRREARGHRGDEVPRIHVSSLIKSGPSDFFCEREFVLKHIERREPFGSGVPPKFELLWETGHFLGNYIVNRFLQRNPEWGRWAWGDWTCPCKATVKTRCHWPRDEKCDNCGMAVDTYLEVDLFNPAKTVIGHADLILCVVDEDGQEWFFIYEFKSIDRADVDYESMKEPLADHVTQASNYYYMLRGEGKRVSKRLRFVYVDRSMQGLYTVKPFKELYANAIAIDRLGRFYGRAKRVHRAIETGVLPDRKCENIKCSRATQCEVAISCMERRQSKFSITSLASTPASPRQASTASRAAKVAKTSTSP